MKLTFEEDSITIRDNYSDQSLVHSERPLSIKQDPESTMGSKILIVDDQTFNVEALKINLKIKGVEEYFEDESSMSSKDELERKATNRIIRLDSYNGFQNEA